MEKYYDGKNWLDLDKDYIGIEEYYLNNKLHRENGPAKLTFI